MSRVFVPQIPSVKGRPVNMTDANRFGSLIVVFGSEVSEESYPDNTDERMPSWLFKASDTLKTFNPNIDYLALTGSPFFITLCVWVLTGLGYESIRLLRFDRREQAYYPITLSDHIEEKDCDQGKSKTRRQV